MKCNNTLCYKFLPVSLDLALCKRSVLISESICAIYQSEKINHKTIQLNAISSDTSNKKRIGTGRSLPARNACIPRFKIRRGTSYLCDANK